jgi:hypothetical protein
MPILQELNIIEESTPLFFLLPLGDLCLRESGPRSIHDLLWELILAPGLAFS